MQVGSGRLFEGPVHILSCQLRLALSSGIETVASNVKAYALPLYFAALKFD